MTKPVLFQRSGSVAWIRFNRPDVLNALDVASAEGLLDAAQNIATDKTVRVVVIAGEGRAFMAGGDVSTFAGQVHERVGRLSGLIDPLHAAIEVIMSLSVPVIASVQGAVAGAGIGIMLSADLAIAADNAVFNMAYAKLGASPDGSSSWSLPRVVGLRKALEIAMLSDNLTADAALKLDLVNRVVPLSSLTSETETLANRLASGPTFGYGRIKHVFRTSLDRNLRDQMNTEKDAFLKCAATEDFTEGVAAFLEKRKATYQGR